MFFCLHFAKSHYNNPLRVKIAVSKISGYVPTAYSSDPVVLALPDKKTFLVHFSPITARADEFIFATKTSVHCLDGYISRRDLAGTQARTLATRGCWSPSDTEKVSGVASFFAYSCETGICLWSTITQTVGLYYANGDDLSVAGTRPMLTHLLAEESDKLRLDHNNIDVRLTSNSWLNHSTPYLGTRRVLPYHFISLSGTKFVTKRMTSQVSSFDLLDVRSASNALADVLMQAIPKEQTNTILLSGGKDSRTVTAAVLANNLPFRGITYGHPEADEPLIASKLASTSGALEFQTRSQPALYDLVQAATRSCMRTEGLITAVAHQVSFDAPEFIDGNILHGHGHILRGGHGLPAVDASAADCKKMAYSAYLSGWIRPQYHAKSLEFLDEWADPFMHNPRTLPLLAHADLRVGVHLAPGILEYAGINRMIYPLCDHNVVLCARGISLELLASEMAVFGAIKKLASDLTEFPLYGEMWAFEKSSESEIFPGRRLREAQYDKNHIRPTKSGLRWIGTRRQGSNEQTAAQYILESRHIDVLRPLFSDRFCAVIEHYSRFGALNDRELKSTLPVQGSVKRKLFEVFSLCALFENKWLSRYRPNVPPDLISINTL